MSSNISVAVPRSYVSRELMRVELKPEARQKQMELESSRLMENLTSPEVHSVHGFVTVYAFLCRYYGIPFREDVAWVSRDVCVCACVCVRACMHACVQTCCVCTRGRSIAFQPIPPL